MPQPIRSASHRDRDCEAAWKIQKVMCHSQLKRPTISTLFQPERPSQSEGVGKLECVTAGPGAGCAGQEDDGYSNNKRSNGSNTHLLTRKSAIPKSERLGGPTSFWVGGAISARLSARLSAARLSRGAWLSAGAYHTQIGHGRTTFFVRRERCLTAGSCWGATRKYTTGP